MIRAGIVVAALLSGCAYEMDIPGVTPDRPDGAVPVADAYPDELEEAMVAWRMHFGLPDDCEYERVYVAGADAETCSGVTRPGGCVLVHRSPLWSGYAYTIVIYDDANRLDVVSREISMWLKLCSGQLSVSSTAHTTDAQPEVAAE